MPVTRIIPEVRSNNLAETRDFYTGILGLVIDMEEGDFLMMSSPANTSAQLIVNDNGHAGLPPGFAVDVGNTQQLQQIYQSVIDRGLPIVEPLTDKPWAIRRFSVIGPTGVRVTVISHIDTSQTV